MSQKQSSMSLALWQRPYFVLVVLLLSQLTLFSPTYWSMVEIWWRSETFAHGFFILPIALFLIWRKRRELAAAVPHSDYRALFPLAFLTFVWLVAYAVDVIAVKQFAVVLMLPALAWLVLGWQTISVITFPLAFLLFAVPFGEFLIYPLMEFTAVFTVKAVRATGIPVFWEGLYFALPSGTWSVVEACSGFRYILASLTLGALYAYLSYRSVWRRAAFMLLALIVPIIANGLRAFMIVMIGHHSGMALAVGVDHLIYGWVWFGVVMFVMFWIGSFWAEKPTVPAETDQPGCSAGTGAEPRGAVNPWLMAVALMMLVLPVGAALMQKQSDSGEVDIQIPQQIADWQQFAEPDITGWQPIYQGATQEIQANYRSGDAVVGTHLAYFASQRQGEELVNRGHRLTHMKEKFWKELGRVSRRQSIADFDVGLIEAQIRSSEQSLLVWQWKYFNGVWTANDFYLKALEAWAKITGKPRHGAAIVLFVPYDSESGQGLEQAGRELQAFAADLLPVLEQQFETQN